MSQPWKTKLLKLGGGQLEEKDVGSGHAGADRVENCVWEEDGVLIPRPGYTEDPNLFYIRGPGDAAKGSGFTPGTTVDLSTLLPVRSILHTGGDEGDHPIVMTDGHLWVRDAVNWSDRLSAWSTRVTRGADVAGGIGGSPATSAPHIAWDFQNPGNTESAAMLSQDGRVVERRANILNTNVNTPGMARNVNRVSAMAWVDGANVKFITRTDGANLLSGITTLATDALNPGVIWMSSSAGSSSFYIAYATTTAGHVNVLKVNSAGTVLASKDLQPSGAADVINAVCVDNSINKVLVSVSYNTIANVYSYLLNASTMADLTIGVATAKAGAGNARHIVCGGVDEAANRGWFAWRTETNDDIYIASRSLTAATAATQRSYKGSTAAAGVPAVRWRTKHQILLWNKRAILGLSVGPDDDQHTWYDIDITDIELGGQDAFANRTTYVARGPLRGSAVAHTPVAAIYDANNGPTKWRFGSTEFDTFDATGGDIWSHSVITVEPTQPAFCEAAGKTLVGGSVPHLVDEAVHEVGFPFLGGSPEIAGKVNGGGAVGGATVPGSFTAQAVWRWMDSSGRIHRSAPSLPVTLTTSVGNQTLQYQVSTDQMTGKTAEMFASGGLRIELYLTDVNPTATAPKYLQTHVANSFAAATVTITLTTGPLTNTETLYTTGGVLANYPIGAQGGVAVLGRRVWVAEQHRVVASKFGQVGDATSWTDEGIIEVKPPASTGSIRAISTMDDKLVIFCEKGIYVTTGDGPDDTASGPDFVFPYHVSDLGVLGARNVAASDLGVFFLDDTDTVYLLSRDLRVTNVSRSVRLDLANANVNQGTLAVNVADGNQLLYICNGLKILTFDFGRNAWAVWTSDFAAVSLTCSSGILWALSDSTGPFMYNDGTPGHDVTLSNGTSAFTQLWRSAHLPVVEDGFGWGRTQSVNVLGVALPSTVTAGLHNLKVKVAYDRESTPFYDSGNLSVDAAAPAASGYPHHPYAPEFTLTRQKCSEVQMTVTASPGLARWNAVGIRYNPTPSRAPQISTNRK